MIREPTTKWMDTARRKVTRLVHDAYAQVAARLWPLTVVRDVSCLPSPDLAVPIDQAGSVEMDNRFESQFHRQDLTAGFHWPDLWLVELHDAFVTGDQGQVFFSGGEFLAICPSLQHLPARKVRRPLRPMARRLPGVYFHLTGVDHENHGHFLFQHLPRLLAAKAHLCRFADDFKVLVAPGHRRWQSRYLKCFGIAEDRVVEASVGTIQVEHLLYVPMPYGNTYLCNPAFYRMIRDGFAHDLASAPPDGSVLFISRQDAPDRRLTNETSAIAICEEVFGKVAVVNLGKLKLEEQIRLCADARIVIGPQGQGMSVVLFMRHGTFVVIEYGEAFHPLGWCRAFCDAASILGVHALRLISGGGFDHQSDWSYPPEKFREEMLRLREQLPVVSTHAPAP